MEERRPRLSLLWHGIAVLLLLFLIFRSFDGQHLFFANDQATDLIVSQLWLSGETPLLGPPASVGARHLGVVYYAFTTLPFLLGISDPVQVTAAYSVLKLVTLLALSWLTVMFAPPHGKRAALLALYLSCTLVSYTEVFRVQWHSHFLLLPSTFTLVALALVIQKGVWFFPLFLLANSLSFLSHLNSVPFVTATFVGAALTLLAKRGLPGTLPYSPRLVSRVLLLALPATGLVSVWAPLMWHELHYPSTFITLFASQQRGSDSSLLGALYAGVEFLRVHSIALAFPGMRFLPLYLVGILVVSPIIVRWIRNSPRAHITWYGTLIGSLMVSVLMIFIFHGPAHAHYLNSSLPIPLLLFAGLVGQIADVPSGGHRVVRASAGVAGVSIAGACFFSLFQFLPQVDLRGGKPYHSLQHALDLGAVIRASVEDPEESRNVLIFAVNSARPMKNAYYYALGSKRYADLEYAPLFGEISSFQGENMTTVAFLASCPRPFSRERQMLFSGLPESWEVAREITLSSYPLLEECSLWQLQKR